MKMAASKVSSDFELFNEILQDVEKNKEDEEALFSVPDKSPKQQNESDGKENQSNSDDSIDDGTHNHSSASIPDDNLSRTSSSATIANKDNSHTSSDNEDSDENDESYSSDSIASSDVIYSYTSSSDNESVISIESSSSDSYDPSTPNNKKTKTHLNIDKSKKKMYFARLVSESKTKRGSKNNAIRSRGASSSQTNEKRVNCKNKIDKTLRDQGSQFIYYNEMLYRHSCFPLIQDAPSRIDNSVVEGRSKDPPKSAPLRRKKRPKQMINMKFAECASRIQTSISDSGNPALDSWLKNKNKMAAHQLRIDKEEKKIIRYESKQKLIKAYQRTMDSNEKFKQWLLQKKKEEEVMRRKRKETAAKLRGDIVVQRRRHQSPPSLKINVHETNAALTKIAKKESDKKFLKTLTKKPDGSVVTYYLDSPLNPKLFKSVGSFTKFIMKEASKEMERDIRLKELRMERFSNRVKSQKSTEKKWLNDFRELERLNRMNNIATSKLASKRDKGVEKINGDKSLHYPTQKPSDPSTTFRYNSIPSFVESIVNDAMREIERDMRLKQCRHKNRISFSKGGNGKKENLVRADKQENQLANQVARDMPKTNVEEPRKISREKVLKQLPAKNKDSRKSRVKKNESDRLSKEEILHNKKYIKLRNKYLNNNNQIIAMK